MSNYDIQPMPTMTINSDEQIRAYINPTRMTILSYLAKEKKSVSMIAQLLKVHPANLTHHFKVLEKVGLIKLVEKRETGKNLEKLYRAVALQFIVDAENEMTNKQVLGLIILRDNLNASIQSLKNQTGEKDVLAVIKTVRINQQNLSRFATRLLDLANEFGKSSSNKGEVYSLNASIYPTDAVDIPGQEISIRVDGE
ncbi:MAG: helix-turn-helix transcriptional regulator [Anaerolineae bacterium]|nr:helix-turn-helix transcriptional regulator [Anaerolineae bacterium]